MTETTTAALRARTARGAVISPCGRFRYLLTRRWMAEGRLLLFVMLNPSTADHEQDDPTIRRCTGFALSHGFPGFAVVNLFAYRATDPADLRGAGWPVGPENDVHLEAAVGEAARVCVAWGAHGHGLARTAEVVGMLRRLEPNLYCLGRSTRTGQPLHPLMLPADRRLEVF